MLAGHRYTLESDISKFLFDKCPTPTLKAEYTYTLSCISQSRCQKTLLRYNAHWFRFRSWCQQNKLSFLPADPKHVAMFLSNSLRFALSRGLTYSTIKAANAAIFTAHNMAGLDDVTSHSFVQTVRSCAQRSLSFEGQIRKAPLSLDLCIITVSFLLQPSQSTLLNLQIATFIAVCFSGFLRYDCACQIFANEVRFYSSHMEMFLAKRKNDQFHSGSVVCIARGKSLSCPVSLLKSLLVKAGSLGKHVPVFRSFKKGFLKSVAPQISPCPSPLLELAFCKLWLILLTCPSQILLTDRACTPFALGVLPSLLRRVFLIIFPGSWSLKIKPGHARIH